MWDLDTIKAMNAWTGAKARREKPVLLRVASGAEFAWPPTAGQVPAVGDAVADYDRRHHRVGTLFVDTSGFGAEGEPTLTMEQFGKKLKVLTEEHGPVLLATVDHGEFQAHVGVWAEGPKASTAG